MELREFLFKHFAFFAFFVDVPPGDIVVVETHAKDNLPVISVTLCRARRFVTLPQLLLLHDLDESVHLLLSNEQIPRRRIPYKLKNT